LSSLRFYAVYLVLLILFISSIIIIKYELPVLLLAEAQQEQSNTTTTATDLAKMRNNTIIPQAQDVDESNLELIKICTASPNLECDNNMINIHNDCIAYPEYIATHIPSCDDSRLISYLIARGLLE
jgi:biopolymer transport protein ExbD